MAREKRKRKRKRENNHGVDFARPCDKVCISYPLIKKGGGKYGVGLLAGNMGSGYPPPFFFYYFKSLFFFAVYAGKASLVSFKY